MQSLPWCIISYSCTVQAQSPRSPHSVSSGLCVRKTCYFWIGNHPQSTLWVLVRMVDDMIMKAMIRFIVRRLLRREARSGYSWLGRAVHSQTCRGIIGIDVWHKDDRCITRVLFQMKDHAKGVAECRSRTLCGGGGGSLDPKSENLTPGKMAKKGNWGSILSRGGSIDVVWCPTMISHP